MCGSSKSIARERRPPARAHAAPSPTVADPFWMMPAKVDVWSLLPAVRTGVPAALDVTVPLPVKPLTVVLKLLRSSVAPLAARGGW